MARYDASVVLYQDYLVVQYESGEDFLEALDGEHKHLMVVRDTLPAGIEVGETLSVAIRFVERRAEFLIHAILRGQVDNRARLELHPEEPDRVELLVAWARGESVPYYERRYERVRVSLEARVTMESGHRFESRVSVLGAGGALIVTEQEVETGDELTVELVLLSGELRRLRATVVGRVTSGPERGFNCEFQFASAIERDAMVGLAARLGGENRRQRRATGRPP